MWRRVKQSSWNMHYKQYKHILSPSGGMNIYRGCSHGCIYCDSRSKCYQMQHDFEDIEVKTDAPGMLESELRKKRRRQMIATGAMTDPYIPLELEIGYTRRCLEVIERHGFGVAVQTKSSRILRDLDLLKSINQNAKCVVQMTLTTFDETLCKLLEPSVCTTKERVETLITLRDNGIPTVVWLCPLLPFINDSEENLRGILGYCAEAGVWGIINFGIGVTLREGDREYFYAALDRHFTGMKDRYHKKYGYRYEVMSDNHDALMRVFRSFCDEHGIVYGNDRVFGFIRELPERSAQTSLF
jgi:DNA repair photolyase